MEDMQARLQFAGNVTTLLYSLRGDMLTQRVSTSVGLPAMDMLTRLIDYAVWGSSAMLYGQLDALKRNTWFMTHEEDMRIKWLEETKGFLDKL